MYKLHLILKYLRKRRIAWVSLIAVVLCTAMVIVVISVMGGWLEMFKQSFHGLTGDVIVHGESLVGFPYYQEMIDRIEKLPEVKAAVPSIETYALININDVRRKAVQVVGYPIEKIGLVNNFPKSLYRQYQKLIDEANDPNAKLTVDERKNKLDEAARHAQTPSFEKPLSADQYRAQLPRAKGDVSKWPGMIAGAGIVNIGRDAQGNLEHPDGLYGLWAKLTVLAISPDSSSVDIGSDKGERNYWIVDDSRTTVWQYDNNMVYVPFDVLQKDLQMDEQTFTDAATGQKEIQPARARDIQIGIKSDADLMAVKDKIQKIVDAVIDEHIISLQFPITVETWAQ